MKPAAKQKRKRKKYLNHYSWRKAFAILKKGGYIKKHKPTEFNECYRLMTSDNSPVRNLHDRTFNRLNDYGRILRKEDGRWYLNDEWKETEKVVIAEKRKIKAKQKEEQPAVEVKSTIEFV